MHGIFLEVIGLIKKASKTPFFRRAYKVWLPKVIQKKHLKNNNAFDSLYYEVV